MLAPIDKLKSGVNNIIQIVVTTACTLQCSNCTQLLNFRKDYRHMSLECFEEAVISLKDWPGIIGIFGGNPCNHPKFPELCAILAKHVTMQHRGLWSNDFLGHGNIVRSTFYPAGTFNLNAHGVMKAAEVIRSHTPYKLIPGSDVNQANHSAILADYRDFGIPEEQWVAMRESCDINQKWSAAIVERDGKPFAYYCEVAAAIDGIRGTNFGIPAVPGWWRNNIADFPNQTEACCDSGCGVPLRIKGHRDNEETYDFSKSWAERFPVVRGSVVVQEIKAEDVQHVKENTDYMNFRKGTE